jgi:serine/threonine-protein kinase
VAVKVLRAELADDIDAVSRLLGERDVLTGIDSPHLVPVRDVVVEGDAVAVVMDLATGVDLRRLLRASPTQPPAMACAIGAQVAAGLAAVHDAGVVHRDVKPENVLVDLSVTDAPFARLTDFGLAGVVAEAGASRTTGVVGTPEYLAPEVAEGAAATPAADVYSLGILLYELCAGRTPFAGGHPVAVLRRQLEDPPLRPPGLPAPLWGLLSWMLDKVPARRPSAEDVGGALEDLAESLVGVPPLEPLPPFEEEEAVAVVAPPPAARPAPVPPRPFRPGTGPHAHGYPSPPRRYRARAMLFAAPLLVALVVAAVVGIDRLDRPPAGPYRFAPFLLENGLAVERSWSFGDDDGAVLLGTAEVHNRSNRAFTGAYDEVLPRSMVRDPANVQRSPAGESPPNEAGDPVLRFAITDLDPGFFWRISYRVEVPADGTDPSRMEDWAVDQRRAFEEWGRSRGGRAQGVPNVLVEFAVDGPERLTLPEGAEYQLPLRGRMADGSPAPPAVLALVRWESDDPAIADVRSGLVQARALGTTDIRAETDELDGWSGTVEVVARGEADVPASDFVIPGGPPRLAPDAPIVDDPNDDRGQADVPSGAACGNGRDDDGDGLTDLDDPGCDDAEDGDEGGDPPPACANGTDDDGDGRIDTNDPGCTSAADDDETNVAPICDNGVDDDGDGLVDLLDPGCADAGDGDETDPPAACGNGADDDGDGATDMEDPGCASPTDPDETDVVPACANGIDDDGDGLVDLEDPGCASNLDGDEGGVDGPPACANGIDDDGDGLVDLADLGCESPEDTDETDRTGASTTTTTSPPPEDPGRGVAGSPTTLGAALG